MNATFLAKLASRLEEEGVVQPNTDVEVSASVSVSPEEQEKIDEEVTKVESVDESGDQAEDTLDEGEQATETEATLRAIVKAVRATGSITPQLYIFLQETGYLEAISGFTGTYFPAAEALSPRKLNSTYTASIVAGCEAGIKEISKSVWEWIKKICRNILEFFQKIWNYLTVNRKKIDAMKEAVAKAFVGKPAVGLNQVNYPASAIVPEKLKDIESVIKDTAPLFKDADTVKASFDVRNNEPEGGFKNKLVVEHVKDAASKLDHKEMTFSEAGVDAKYFTGPMYNTVIACMEFSDKTLKTYKKLLNDVSDMERKAAAEDKNPSLSEKAKKSNATAVKERIAYISSAFKQLGSITWKVTRSYMVVGNVMLKNVDKEGAKAISETSSANKASESFLFNF